MMSRIEDFEDWLHETKRPTGLGEYSLLYEGFKAGADKAEQSGRELAELLSAARCPNCDGSGAIAHGNPNGDFELEQCQWCYERDVTLADHKKKGDPK